MCLHLPPRSSEGEESSLYPSSPSEPPTIGSPHPSEPLTPLDEIYTPLGGSVERHKVPPTPPPSTEGEDCKSMEGNEMEIWRVGRDEGSRGEEEDEEEDGRNRKSPGSEREVEEDGERNEEEVNINLLVSNTDEDNASEPPDTNAPPSSSSSSFVIPELRLDRSFSADALSSPNTDDEDYDEEEEEESEDEEEEEEDEDDSDDAYLQRSDSKRRSMVEGATCEKHGGGGLSVQNSLRRRTHSEGSLLQDPRTPCFTSDNAINCLEVGGGHHKGGWTLPSPKTLKKELTKNGGSMHQLCMLFSGRKVRRVTLKYNTQNNTKKVYIHTQTSSN